MLGEKTGGNGSHRGVIGMTRLATVRRSFPTLMLIAAPFRWIGRSRRRIWGAVLATLVAIAVPPLWWELQLTGLPDVVQPFDAAAFRAFTIPDDRNAYREYGEAAALLKPWKPAATIAPQKVDAVTPWSTVAVEVRQWADLNREALTLFRRGTERPDALGAVPKFRGEHFEEWEMYRALQTFERLALLEGSRLEELGDMAGAWGWYRAVLRAAHHIRMHGTVYRRSVAHRWLMDLWVRLAEWAADSRTTPALIRQALDDVVACESLAPSESYTIKAEYLDVVRLLDDPDRWIFGKPRSWSIAISSLEFRVSEEQNKAIHDAWRFWRREPERSRRMMRLAVANWLANFELSPQDRQRPVRDPSGRVVFYPPRAGAAGKTPALSPQALFRWLGSSIDAKFLLENWGWNTVRTLERSAYRELLILLGQELYRRDHGTDPPSPEAFVGRYLKSLPAEFPDDERDETIPAAN
jgi:hypothetical protein